MADEPAVKRAIAFFDGQNLYRHAKDAFGHHHPNYHPIKLFDAVCADKGWESRGVRFYMGTPSHGHSEMWTAIGPADSLRCAARASPSTAGLFGIGNTPSNWPMGPLKRDTFHKKRVSTCAWGWMSSDWLV